MEHSTPHPMIPVGEPAILVHPDRRKPYVPPSLFHYGTIQELTGGTTGGVFDDTGSTPTKTI